MPDRSLGGIKDMGGLPDMIFVIDTNKEDIAIQEAQRLNIPVAASSIPPDLAHHLGGAGKRRRWPRHFAVLRSAARAPRLTASRVRRAIQVSISALSVSRFARSFRPRRRRLASRVSQGCGGTADDLKKLTACVGAIEKKLNDLGIFHYRQSPNPHRHRAQDRRRSRIAEPGRSLGRSGQDADCGRLTVTAWLAFRHPSIPDQDIPVADSGADKRRFLYRQEGHSTMATITAAMVKDLRESTGAGMMDCKQALTENNGDSAGGD